MTARQLVRRRALVTTVSLLCASSLGCFAIDRGATDWDTQPVINTGVGATIIRPNQNAPMYYPPGTQPAPQPQSAPSQYGAPPTGAPQGGPPQGAAPGAAPQTANPSYGSAPTVTVGPNGEQRSGGTAAPNQTPITMIGGAEQDITGHRSWKQEPVWLKYLMLPVAVAAAPFKAMVDDPEPGPELPRSQPLALGAEAPPATAPPPRATDYESAMVDELARELDARNRQTEATAPSTTAQPRAATASASRAPSFSEELADLQRAPEWAPRSNATTGSDPRPGSSAAATPVPAPRPPAPTTAGSAGDARADGIVDRDGDGRIDQWIYRERGQLSRVELDENADGRPDRSIHYDLATQAISSVEEDANHDGSSDSWTEYEDGQVARRRGDGNFDGVIDTWTFYRKGVITRHDQDTNGDGFRDRVGYYSNGKIAREETDADGDGRPDAVLYYDSLERISRREEDRDQDGRPDVISHYEAGKLSRKEMITNDGAPETARP